MHQLVIPFFCQFLSTKACRCSETPIPIGRSRCRGSPGGFPSPTAMCRKLVHLARSKPPSHVADGLALFDKDVRQCFSECTALNTSDIDWMQAQLSLSRGGLGLRSLSCHSVAAYLASLSSSGFDKSFNLHLSESIMLFNELVPAAEELLATSNLCQHTLSSKIERLAILAAVDLSSPAHRARLLSVSSRHAASCTV